MKEDVITYSKKHNSQEVQHIILFDGVCNLCSGWVYFLLKRSAAEEFYFCAVQSETGQKLLSELGLPTDRFDTMVYLKGGKPLYKSNALLGVVGQLSWPWRIACICKYLPEGIRDWIYDRLAQNRYAIAGKRDSCYLAEKHQRYRFI